MRFTITLASWVYIANNPSFLDRGTFEILFVGTIILALLQDINELYK